MFSAEKITVYNYSVIVGQLVLNFGLKCVVIPTYSVIYLEVLVVAHGSEH